MAKGDPRSGEGAGFFPAIYQSAMEQSAGDYDSIMGQYRGLGERASRGDYGDSSSENYSGGNINFSPISPSFSNYEEEDDFSNLRDFAETGGFSGSDIGNIRERAVSPIRSIYDSANQNLLRQKSLQGGYSPNMGASIARMARESAGIIGEKTTAANADIAQMVQRGKLAGATALAPLEARESERRQDLAMANTNIANQANMFNIRGASEVDRYNAEANRANRESSRSASSDNFNRILQTIQGQQSTYGTTPALANTFGSQVLNAANQVGNFPPVKAGSSYIRPINPMSGGAYDERRGSY